MKAKTLLTLAATLASLCGAAHGSVIYQFSFSSLRPAVVSLPRIADFGITLEYPDYVTSPGMKLLEGGPITSSTASLGYGVAYAGTNVLGWWGFDATPLSSISNLGYSFSLQSFLFKPQPFGSVTDFYRTPGSYVGNVGGNFPGAGFQGQASLVIRDTNAELPEPPVLALVALACAGLAATRRTRRR
jgi:hypothetical protein